MAESAANSQSPAEGQHAVPEPTQNEEDSVQSLLNPYVHEAQLLCIPQEVCKEEIQPGAEDIGASQVQPATEKPHDCAGQSSSEETTLSAKLEAAFTSKTKSNPSCS